MILASCFYGGVCRTCELRSLVEWWMSKVRLGSPLEAVIGSLYIPESPKGVGTKGVRNGVQNA